MNHAIVTGASKGIGRAIAKELASRGRHLILVARSQDLLDQLCVELSSGYNIDARALALDLTDHASTLALRDWVDKEGLKVDMLINNAGLSLWGPYIEADLDRIHLMNSLNIDAVLRLTHHFLPHLLSHPKSYLLNVSSMGGYTPLPYKANYGASKAYLTSFTRALRYEHRRDPIHICALCPGGISTENTGNEIKGTTAEKTLKYFMEPDKCAKIAIDRLFKNKAETVPGFTNRLGQFFSRFISKSYPIGMAGRIFANGN